MKSELVGKGQIWKLPNDSNYKGLVVCIDKHVVGKWLRCIVISTEGSVYNTTFSCYIKEDEILRGKQIPPQILGEISKHGI